MFWRKRRGVAGGAGIVSDRRVLLIVGGGIAAYKCLELVRLLRGQGIAVRPVLTPAGSQFVTPLSLAALCEDKVHTDLFSLTDEAEMGHIRLSRSADLIVVAPATADLMARTAAGLANDLATTLLLATDTPVMMVPAMNVRMWTHPATQRNLATLKADGVRFVGPDVGDMACGETGPGRMAEPAAICAAILAALAGDAGLPLAGRRVLVTAGPTAEPVDPVRVLTNRSSGKQGFAIAAALANLGAEVTLVAGPVAEPTPPGVRRVDVETAREMLAACEAALPADVAVCVAAVADWRPAEVAAGKTKKTPGAPPPEIRLVENPDILATLSRAADRPRLVVGFAAETETVEDHARAKLARKGCDWIVANDVSRPGVMGGSDNTVSIVTRDGVERWEEAPKAEVARRLAARIAAALGGETP
ncbi:MAG: bifunctional phosphopantothenoylcysteine decarboxylase/phosphopantothenate--cysteine ligase CoaBC [Phenylobacterium sp.]|nr:bifunctional phosphopantothenoylcysteine decarboxylase/phosphopantothenate--cysteine ligase CoaBC [Phenylobacterium sp.]